MLKIPVLSEEKMILLPSLDQEGSLSSTPSLGRETTPKPSAHMKQISLWPFLNREKTIFFPSGENLGVKYWV